MKTQFEDIVHVQQIGQVAAKKFHEIANYAQREKLSPASDDLVRTLFVGIDMQNDFMENGALGVPGSHQDVHNAARFIYNNIDKITKIAVSLDTHRPLQIFHPAWWYDDQGNAPAPFTIITAEDVQNGTWKAVMHAEESLEYVLQLNKSSQRDLCIWPYHCLQGTYGAALEGQIANMVYFHSIARKSEIQTLIKGTDPLTEMYGIIRAEYDKNKYKNISFLDELRQYDKLIFAGEAKSHCVLESVRQIIEHYEQSPDLTSKIYLLEDCMSPITGYEVSTEKTFEMFQTKYGVNVIHSTELTL